MLTITDITDGQFFRMVAEQHPQAAEMLLTFKAGSKMRIPTRTELLRDTVARLDDGTRTRAEVAQMAGCSVSTVKRARKKNLEICKKGHK